MNFKLCIILFISFLSVIGCEHPVENVPPPYDISLMGKWQGELDGMQMLVQFEEVSFEGVIFLTGNATLTIDAQSADYRVMNGGRGESELTFALYREPVVTKEEFHINGTIKSETLLQGTYKQFEIGPSNPQVIKTGLWMLNKID